MLSKKLSTHSYMSEYHKKHLILVCVVGQIKGVMPRLYWYYRKQSYTLKQGEK